MNMKQKKKSRGVMKPIKSLFACFPRPRLWRKFKRRKEEDLIQQNNQLLLTGEIIGYIVEELNPELAKKFIGAGIYVSPITILKTQDDVTSFLNAVYDNDIGGLQYVHTIRFELESKIETEKALQTINHCMERRGPYSLGSYLKSVTTLCIRNVSVQQFNLFLKLSQLSSLTTVDLAENKMGSTDFRCLVEELVNLKSLTTLNLASNDLTGSGLRSLGRLHSLQELNLEGNKRIRKFPISLNQAFASLRSLKILNLAGNQIGYDNIPSLGHLKSLTELNLKDNLIGRLSDERLNKIFSQLTSLQKLNLDDNWIGSDGAKSLCHLTLLTELRLAHNWLNASSNANLDAVFAGLKYLRELDLEGNMLGRGGNFTGLRSLGEKLGKLDSLVMVNLRLNDIHDDGAQYLFEKLPHCKSLKKLDLSANDFDKDRCKGLMVKSPCQCEVIFH